MKLIIDSRDHPTDLAGVWSSLMFFDSMIFILTLFKAIQLWKLGTRRLTHVLLRDGRYLYYTIK